MDSGCNRGVFHGALPEREVTRVEVRGGQLKLERLHAAHFLRLCLLALGQQGWYVVAGWGWLREGGGSCGGGGDECCGLGAAVASLHAWELSTIFFQPSSI